MPSDSGSSAICTTGRSSGSSRSRWRSALPSRSLRPIDRPYSRFCARRRPAVQPVLREARDALTAALAELRELTQGIRPAILVERGLAAALDDLSRRAALPVRLDVTVSGRLPEQVEGGAYFVASEALANAAKHSHASEVRLAASRVDDVLVVEVVDDGIGGAAAVGGSGLRGLGDRVEALGGRLTISSPPGRGTRIHAEIPCA